MTSVHGGPDTVGIGVVEFELLVHCAAAKAAAAALLFFNNVAGFAVFP